MSEIREEYHGTGFEVAVIGMAGQFPGAPSIAQFWENLKNGVESVAFVTDATGPIPGGMDTSAYVGAMGGPLEDKEYFDAAFFGFTPGEATLMDPQMRLLHETAWTALEDAGYDPGRYEGLIGFYAGSSGNFSWEALTITSGTAEETGGPLSTQFIDRDFLSTRISYRLNLRGPAFTVQTACSTSLVAIHLAVRGILSGECEMALAGGVALGRALPGGYLFREGMILSQDGHCRAFDARAKGTIGGEGVGVVVLKALEEAIHDRDHIYAVVKGSALNNDGARKVGFSAPSIEGQADVIKSALIMAEVEASGISYIETHGTGTELGDPVEIQALKLAFNTPEKHFCALGSVKSNIGHLDAAAGVTGFIKTVLVLKHRLIPPSLHFTAPNPRVDFENSPFYVANRVIDWNDRKDEPYPLRAGVSAFGIGGTNAHVVLEEWRNSREDHRNRSPQLAATAQSPQLILLSALTPTALEQTGRNLAAHLKTHPGLNPADVAYTLQLGRKTLKHRKTLVADSTVEIIEQLTTPGSEKVRTFAPDKETCPVAFMFPGQGAQYLNMGLQLYESEPVFRKEMDHCFEILKPLAGYDMKEILYPSSVPSESSVANNKEINQTEIAQPLIFVIEYALAVLLRSYGIRPAAMIGHSIGEYTAACLAGVFSLEDALRIVSFRGRLMQQAASGSMLGVSLSEQELVPLLPPGLALAAVNSPGHCVVSGPDEATADFDRLLQDKGFQTRKLHTSHAFHSAMMDPVLDRYAAEVKKIRLNKPGEPVLSNVTGRWLSDQQAVDPGYWVEHLRRTVRFHDGLQEIVKKNIRVLVEVGPGNSLSTFARYADTGNNGANNGASGTRCVNVLRHPRESVPDNAYFLDKIGQLWLYGAVIDWRAGNWDKNTNEKPYRVPLPTYPFERQRFWIEGSPAQIKEQVSAGKQLRESLERVLVSEGIDALQRMLKEYLPQLSSLSQLSQLSELSELSEHSGGVVQTTESVAPAAEPAESTKSTMTITLRQRPDLSVPYVPPRKGLEETLARIWREFFGIETIGINDDFFELGGDSLRAASLLAKIHKDLNLAIPIAAFFNQATIKGQVRYCETRQGRGVQEDYLSMATAEEKEYYELSPAQERLFILHQMEPDRPVYNMPDVLVLEGYIDEERMNRTFRELIRRHESLRTSFEVIEGHPRQRVHNEAAFALEIYESVQPGGSPDSPAGAERELSVVKEFIRPFDLACPPLIRIGLLRLLKTGENAHLLMLDMHHIAADGASGEILRKEFLALYQDDQLPPLKLQYRDYVQWRNRRAYAGDIKKLEYYWLKEFEYPAPLLRLPLDYPRPQQQQFSGENLRVNLGPEYTGRLRELARKENVTLFVLLFAVYNVFLAKLSGQEDIVVGTAAAGRTHADLENIIGMFVNTLALRNYPLPSKRFKDFLQEVKRRTLEAFDHQEYQFDDLVEKLMPRRDTGRNPLFDVMFSYLTQKLQSEPGGGNRSGTFPLTAKPYPFEFKESKFDLTLGCVETDNYLVCAIQYSTALFKPATGEKFLKYFQQLLDVVLADSSIPLKDITLSHDLKTLDADVYKHADSEFDF